MFEVFTCSRGSQRHIPLIVTVQYATPQYSTVMYSIVSTVPMLLRFIAASVRGKK